MFHFILRTVPRPILIKLSLIFSKIAPLLYYGNRFEDPISGKTYRKFLPYGYSANVKRDNALCPGSLSLERHRLLWLYLKEKTDSIAPSIIFHAANNAISCLVSKFKLGSNSSIELVIPLLAISSAILLDRVIYKWATKNSESSEFINQSN